MDGDVLDLIPAGAEGVMTCECGHRIIAWPDRANEFERELDAHVEAHALIKLFESIASA